MRGNNFSYLVKQGVASVWHNKLMSFASFCILMVSLLLVGISVLVMLNVNIVMGSIEDTNEMTVILAEDVTDETITHINDAIGKNQYVSEVIYYSKDEALEDFKEDMSDYATLLDYLPENPMPETFKVRISDLTKMSGVVYEIKQLDGVDKVNAPYDFASLLVNIRNTFTVLATAVLLSLIVVSVVISSNATRTSVYARRKEINIMKYVGATNGFIKAPFFVEGMFIGIIAGLASWGLTQVVYNAVYSLFAEELTIWSAFGFLNLIAFEDITWYVLGANCLAGAFLGAIGTVFSTGKHLKV